MIWVAVVFKMAFWTGKLVDRYAIQEFKTEQECVSFAKKQRHENFWISCYEKGKEPDEFHAE